MRSRSFRGLIAPVCLFFAAACGGDSSSSETGDVPAFSGPPPVNAGAPAAQQPSGEGGGAEPALPAGGSSEPASGSSEGQVPVTGLQPPATDPPSSGSGDGMAGASSTTPPATETPEPPATEPPPTDNPEAEPAPEPRTQVFLLFGQSNMFGVPAPQGQDLPATEGAEVLTLQACNAHGMNQWVPAQPPLHGCVGQPNNSDFGPGLGPGDYFAKTLTAAFPDDTILLVPNAIAGVSIDTFAPGAQAYNSLVSRARMAQQRGEIRGLLFHQGEADTGSPTWIGRVANVVSSLRRDLGLGEGVPFIAGELPVDGCCGSGHNGLINQLPSTIPNTFVVSAQGLSSYPEPSGDFAGTRLHFDVGAQRELGRRYASTFMQIPSGQ